MGYIYSVENVTKALDQSDAEKMQIVQNVANKLLEYAGDIDKIHEFRYFIKGKKILEDSLYIRDGVWLNVNTNILSLGRNGIFEVAITPVIAKIADECLWLNDSMISCS